MRILGHFSSYVILALCLLGCFIFVACPTSEESSHVLSLKIDKDNDSLLRYDTIVITAFSHDSADSQVVFKGKLTDPNQVQGLPLEPKIGDHYIVKIIGYKSGKIAMQKEIIVLGKDNFSSKDVPVHVDRPETTVIEPTIPEILLATSDSIIKEGDTLRVTLHVKNKFPGTTTFTMKNSPVGASLDTSGLNGADTIFQWVPDFSQGRSAPYSVTFVYSNETRKIERPFSITVRNVNRAPKISPIGDKKIKEGEQLAFSVEVTDPDNDSIIVTASGLPDGALFSGRTLNWTPNAGQAGNYSIRFKAFDGQDSDLAVVLISVGNPDPPPPLVVRITSPAQDSVTNSSPFTVLYSVNGTVLQKKFLLKEGKNKLFIDTTVLGRSAFDTVIVIFDTTPPNKPMVLASSPVNILAPSWHWKSGGGGGNGKFKVKLDDGNLEKAPVTSDTAYTPATDLSIGTHTLYVEERDIAGNWSSTASAAVRIDTLPPDPPVVSSSNGDLTNNPRPSWKWISGGQGDIGLYRTKLDNPDFTASDSASKAKSYIPTSNLSDGSHTLFVWERDSAGNWSKPGSCTIRIDVTPPGAPVLLVDPPTPLNSLTPSWNWISGGGGIGKYRFGLDTPDLSNAPEFSGTKYTVPNALSEGAHTLYVQEKDSAGNWSASGTREIVLALRGPAGSAAFSPGQAYDISLALAKDNTPIVAFRDGWNDYKATAMRLNGASWQSIGKPGFSSGRVFATSLALDGNGTPYVAYEDGDSSFRASVMKYSGSSWTLVGPQGFSHESANDLQIGILKNGRPLVTLRDSAERGSALQFNGTSWEFLGPTEFPFLHINLLVQTISPSGTPFVVYVDAANEKKLSCMKFNGTTWEPVGNLGFTPWPVQWASIAVDSKDIPYVAFDGPTVMKLNGGTWELVGQEKFAEGQANYISIAIDKNDLPYVAFADAAFLSKLSVMRYNSPSWQYLGGPAISVGGAEYISIALSSYGVPYVGFSDLGRSGNATVIKASFDPLVP